MTSKSTHEKKSEPASTFLPAPSDQVAIAQSKARISARHLRLKTRVSCEKKGVAVIGVGPEHDDRDGWLARLDDAFGSNGQHFSLTQLNHILKFSRGQDGKFDAAKVNALLAAVDGARPENEMEAMLTLQMAVTHDLAMQALQRAQRVDQIAQYDSAGGMAVRLMRTFVAQVEALAKLKRGGEQTVRVVHVHPGAQAVIGNVQTGQGGGVGSENEHQPHAKDE